MKMMPQVSVVCQKMADYQQKGSKMHLVCPKKADYMHLNPETTGPAGETARPLSKRLRKSYLPGVFLSYL